jgi:hypothetical protein
VEVIAGHPGSEETTAQEIHNVLLEGLQQGALDGKYRATGLCYEVRVRRGDADPGTDAIAVALEHSDGTALDSMQREKMTQRRRVCREPRREAKRRRAAALHKAPVDSV